MNTKFIVNVEACILINNKWLLIRRGLKESHAPGLISLVGGKMDEKDSSLESTIKREVLEEVGIYIKDSVKYVESNYFISEKGNLVLDIVFLCEYRNGNPEIQSKEEVAEILELSTEEVKDGDNIPDWTKKSILKASKLIYEHKKN